MLDIVRSDADTNTTNGMTVITPSQAKFLARRLDNVDLSVRSMNCLKHINIKYLGELVQYSCDDLLRVHNFGRKSLVESVELFARENLSLGLFLPEWKAESASETVCQVSNRVTSLHLSPAQCAFLAQRIDQIDLSVRTFNCLTTFNIKYLDELVQCTPNELLRIQHFGANSLNEVIAIFAEMNLSLGLHIPDWTPDFASSVTVEGAQDATIEALSEDLVSPTQKVFLAQRLSNLHLSKRVAQIIHETDIARVGDLAILSVDRTKELVRADQRVARTLGTLGLRENLLRYGNSRVERCSGRRMGTGLSG